MIKHVVKDGGAEIVHEKDSDGEYAYLNCYLPVQIVYEKSRNPPMYCLYDIDGSIVEEIEVEDMPQKWRKLFEKDL